MPTIWKTTSHFSKRFIRCAGVILILSVIPVPASGQNIDQHKVTIDVQPVSLLQVSIGTVRMNITGVGLIAGQDQMTITDQSTTVMWGTNISDIKISVKTNLAVQKFVMKIFAVNPTFGSASSEVTLSTVDRDLIRDIGRSSGSSIVQYTGTASASQGAGTDIHSITFTMQSQ